MTAHSDRPQAEPSIVVDPALTRPKCSKEETVVFRREMFIAEDEQPQQRRSLRPWILVCAAVILGALVVRLFVLQR